MLSEIYNSILPDSAPWVIYVIILIGPFIQEDAAVIIAASLSATGTTQAVPTFIIILIGLFFSDIWKYWIGWAALKNGKVQSFANQEKILNLQENIQSNPLTLLVIARFIPLTRVPALIACGFFKMSYFKFCLIIATTALVYVSVIFAAFHIAGTLIEDSIKWILPLIGVALAALTILYHFWRRRTGT